MAYRRRPVGLGELGWWWRKKEQPIPTAVPGIVSEQPPIPVLPRSEFKTVTRLGDNYFVVSTVNIDIPPGDRAAMGLFGTHETLVFPGNANGEIVSFDEIDGIRHHAHDAQQVHVDFVARYGGPAQIAYAGATPASMDLQSKILPFAGYDGRARICRRRK